MPWIVSGSCNYCGICCKPPVVIENPCISLGEDSCKFYTDDVDPSTRFGHCLVLWVSQPKNARDIDGNKINQEQLDWFNHNCSQFPQGVKNLQQLLDGLWDLPIECGFSIEEVP